MSVTLFPSALFVRRGITLLGFAGCGLVEVSGPNLTKQAGQLKICYSSNPRLLDRGKPCKSAGLRGTMHQATGKRDSGGDRGR